MEAAENPQMRWFRFAVLVLLIAVTQAGFLAGLSIKPDLLLILLVFFGVYCGPTDAIITSFSIGFAADIIGSAMGPRMISFGVVGTLLAYLHRVIAVRKMPYQGVAICVTGLVVGTLARLLAFFKGEPFTSATYMVILWTAVYSGIVGPFLFLPVAWWMRIRMGRFSRR
jgi:rod shape-determining protein MreD